MRTPKDQAASQRVAPIEIEMMDSDINFLSLGADALQGIGKMMQAERFEEDSQLSLTMRSDLSAIFCFFGEALGDRARSAGSTAWRLKSVKESDPA